MDEKELFENLCFTPDWSGLDEVQSKQEVKPFVSQRKDLATLLGEMEQIKNTIEDIKAREWHLAKLMRFHEADFVPR